MERTIPMDQDIILKRRRNLIKAIQKVPMAHAMGFNRLSYNDKGEAVLDMPYNEEYDHALGEIHGGVFATLLDSTGWFTVAPYYENWVATVEFNVRLLEHVQGKDLQAVGHIVRLGTHLATATMEVMTPRDKQIVAAGSGTFTVTSVKAFF